MRLGLSILAFAALASGQQPDALQIVRRSTESMERNEYKVHQYTWHRERVFFRLDKNGKHSKETTLTFDAMRKPDGTGNEEVLMTRDGKVMKRSKQGQDGIDTGIRGNINLGIHIGMIPDMYDLTYLREDVFGGRKCWVVTATPSLQANPKNQNERNVLNYRLTIWITQEGFHDSRWIMEVIGDPYPMAKGSSMEWVEQPNEDGVWLASEMHWRYTAAKGNARGEIHDVFTNYRKFDVNSRVTVDPQ